MRRRWTSAVGLGLVLGGCGGAADPPHPDVSGVADVYVEQIDTLLAGNASDLERAVLSDYRVTDEEHEQAQLAFRECVVATEPGLVVQFTAGGGFDIQGSPAFWKSAENKEAGVEAIDRAVRACGPGTLQNIDAFYGDMRTNPEGLTFTEALRGCLEASGLADAAGLSDAELEEMVQAGTFEPSGPEAEACMADPWGAHPSVDQSDAATP